MRGSESLVHRIGRLGDRANSMLQFDLLKIVTEDRVLKPQLASLRRVCKASDRPLSRDRASLESERVGEVYIDKDRCCDDNRRRSLEVMHDGDEDPR